MAGEQKPILFTIIIEHYLNKNYEMKIQIVHDCRIPVVSYGGTERVIWYLGKELAKMGHDVSYLVPAGSNCDFARIQILDPERPKEDQIDTSADVVHFQDNPARVVEHPHVATIHSNIAVTGPLDKNCIFVSANHAQRYNSKSFVYNGLDWDDYGPVDPDVERSYYHFLGKAAWRVKNVQGAIDVIRDVPGEKLYVLGGTRLNLKMGFRFTTSPRIRFFGMVGGEEKIRLLRSSKGLVFPVRWHEPFGLAATESLYFGCPVFGTPYGSLPELITPEVGRLSNNRSELARYIREADFDHRKCHQYAVDLFNSRIMAQEYLKRYERVLNGEPLNPEPPQAQKCRDWPLAWE